MNYAEPQRNPALDIFRQRKWSQEALFPTVKTIAKTRRKKVFVIAHEARRFAVVAFDYIEASNHLDSIL